MRKIIATIFVVGAALAGCQQAPEATVDTPEDVEAGPPSGSPPAMGDPKDNPDMIGFAAEVDVDGNGEMSRAEWEAKGLPDSSFDMFEKGRGFVTLKDYQENAAPQGIDINGDGKVTVAEFVEFDKAMSAKMSDGPPPPAGSAPQQ